jgi:aminoacrylate hydrolase
MTQGIVDGLHYELHGGPVAGREVVLLSSGLGGSGAFWGRRCTP